MEEQKDIFDHLKRKEGFTPDKAYFERLAENVMASQSVKIVPLYKKPVLWMSAAAAIIAAVFIINFDSNTSAPDNVLLALNDISKEEIRTYIEENIEDFDTDLIVEFVTLETIEHHTFIQPEEVESEDQDLVLETISLGDIEREDILDYFEREEIDLLELEDDESFI